jgi:threonine dehydrogenase-like Zn-dependent dehydrogenase
VRRGLLEQVEDDATMRRLMWLGGASQEVQECPIPEPGPGQVRVKVHACGVCMTEVHYADGLFPVPEPAPFVWGHEWGGTVDALGPGVTGVEVGAAVSGSSRGGFAEYVVLPAANVVPLPPGVPLDACIFVEPLACCWASVQAAAPKPGMTALVTGAGPMGQMTAQLTRLAGARVLVSDPDERCRALAVELGAEAAVDPIRESVADAVRAFVGANGAIGASGAARTTDAAGLAGAGQTIGPAMPPGAGPDYGVDIALESAGNPSALADCIDAVRPGGTIIMVGVAPEAATLPFPIWRFHRRQLNLKGVYGSGGIASFRAAVAALPQLSLTTMISHRFGLGEIDQAYALARSGQRGKLLVEPWR